MSLSVERLSTLRRTALGAAGLVCLAYALGALALGRPDPMSPWIPGIVGIGAALAIFAGAAIAGDRNAEMAMDEGYAFDSHRAQRLGYWIALALYPAFGLALFLGWVTYPVAFAAMGTLTGAAFLIAVTFFEAQGRGQL